MTKMQQIRDFLDQKRFAVVGVSRQPNDFSRMLFRELLSRGYQAVPVNPDAAEIGTEIEGQTCFARLQEIQPPVEGVLFMTAPGVTAALVHDCSKAGIKRVWMYRAGGVGSATPDTIQYCEDQGIPVIPGECPFMFLPGGAWYHRFHGLVRKIAGSYPC